MQPCVTDSPGRSAAAPGVQWMFSDRSIDSIVRTMRRTADSWNAYVEFLIPSCFAPGRPVCYTHTMLTWALPEGWMSAGLMSMETSRIGTVQTYPPAASFAQQATRRPGPGTCPTLRTDIDGSGRTRQIGTADLMAIPSQNPLTQPA